MRRSLASFVWFLALTACLAAQVNSTAIYDIAGATPSTVATYQQVITVDGVVQTAAPVCVAKGTTDTTCTVALNAPLTSGSHVISVGETLNGMTAELRVTGIDPNKAPKSATSVRIISTTTIVIP